MNKIFLALIFTLSISIHIQSQSTGIAYVIGGNSGNSNQFVNFDLEDIENNYDYFGTTTVYWSSADFGPDGKYYVTNLDGELFTIDTVTGEATFIKSIFTGAVNGFTYSPFHSKYFAVSGSILFEIDPLDFTVTQIGPMFNAGNMLAFGADFNGKLYGIDGIDNSFYKIDASTGLSTRVGPLGITLEYLQNGTFDKNNNRFIHAAFNPLENIAGFYTIDLNTGEANLLADNPGSDELMGLAFHWNQTEYAEINGFVVDAMNQMSIENVEITLVPDDPLIGNVSKFSDENGSYKFENIPAGTYSIRAKSFTHDPIEINDIEILSSKSINLNIEMNLGSTFVSFEINHATSGNKLKDIEVSFIGQIKISDDNGMITFSNVPKGNFNFEAKNEAYYDGFGNVTIEKSEISQTINLYPLDNKKIDLVILEEATGTWCVQCPGAALGLDDLILNDFPVAVIAYHNGDNYVTQSSDARNGYYSVWGFPTVNFNGWNSITTGNPENSMFDIYKPEVDYALEKETQFEIDIRNINLEGNNLQGEIMIKNRGPLNSDFVFLRIAITESHIQESWFILDELNFVERAMYPDAIGQIINTQEPDQFIFPFEFNLDSNWNTDNMEVVAFIQDDTDLRIHNGAKFDLGTIASSNSISNEWTTSIYPNPSNEYLTIEAENYNFNRIQILNPNTGVVKNSQLNKTKLAQLNVSNLEDGFYILFIHLENEVIQKKFVVSK